MRRPTECFGTRVKCQRRLYKFVKILKSPSCGINDVMLLGDDVGYLSTVNNTYYAERETLTHAPRRNE